MSEAVSKIDYFDGKNRFLSNFYGAEVEYEGITYKNSEAAFQAAKCADESMRVKFADLNPSEAKSKGRRIDLRHDWEDVKFDVMYAIVKAKFTQNKELSRKLVETGDAYLEEGNTWGDKTWGTVNGEGQNNLGKILMRVREELKENMKEDSNRHGKH